MILPHVTGSLLKVVHIGSAGGGSMEEKILSRFENGFGRERNGLSTAERHTPRTNQYGLTELKKLNGPLIFGNWKIFGEKGKKSRWRAFGTGLEGENEEGIAKLSLADFLWAPHFLKPLAIFGRNRLPSPLIRSCQLSGDMTTNPLQMRNPTDTTQMPGALEDLSRRRMTTKRKWCREISINELRYQFMSRLCKCSNSITTQPASV